MMLSAEKVRPSRFKALVRQTSVAEMRFCTLLTAATFFCLQPIYVEAQELGELLLSIPNPSPRTMDQFGFSMGRIGDRLIVGGYDSYYVYDPITGSQELAIPSPEVAGIVTSYPRAVAGVQKWIAIGQDDADVDGNVVDGVVFLFDAETGERHLTIKNPARPSPYFGYEVADAHDRLLVSNVSGTVHLFDPESGELLDSWDNPEPPPAPGDWHYFGIQAEAWGEKEVLVSAPGNKVDSTRQAGVVYLFDETGNVLQRIANPEPSAGSFFGWSIDVFENHLLVGAPGLGAHGDDDASFGAAYLFDVAKGELLFTLKNPEPKGLAHFGESVAITDNHLIVGCPNVDLFTDVSGGLSVGAAYIFDRTTGTYLDRVLDPTPSQNERFSGNNQLIGFGDRFIAGGSLEPVGGFDAAGSIGIYAVPEPSSIAIGLIGAVLLMASRSAAGRARRSRAWLRRLPVVRSQ